MGRDVKDINAEIGARVVMFREQRGVSQSSLAEALGVGQSTASRLEKGEVPWKADVIAATAAFLRVPTSSLWPDEDNPPHLGKILTDQEWRHILALRAGDELEAIRGCVEMLRLTRKA